MVFIDEVIAVDLVDAIMLACEASIEAEVLLPLNHSQGGIERIEIGDLDVPGVFVVVAVGERDAVLRLDMVTLSAAASRNAHESGKTTIDFVHTHAHVNERDS